MRHADASGNELRSKCVHCWHPHCPCWDEHLCILWSPERQLHPLKQNLWDLPQGYREAPKQMREAQMRVGSTGEIQPAPKLELVYWWCTRLNQCTAQVFFPGEARGASLACPDIKCISLLPFLGVWCKSPFLLSKVVFLVSSCAML